MKISIYQGSGFPGDISLNVNLIEEKIISVKKGNSDVIIFPELFLTGYNIPIDNLKEMSREINQELILSNLAKKYGIAIICGFSQMDEVQKIENLCGFWDKKGSLLHRHKKVFLWGNEVENFSQGKLFQTFKWGSVTVGMCICFDIEFPESVRILTANGAEIVFCVSAAMDDHNIIDIMVPTRAMENQIFVVYCNRSGQVKDIKYFGKSIIASPEGNILSNFSEQEVGIKTSSIDLSLIKKSRNIFSYIDEYKKNKYYEYKK